MPVSRTAAELTDPLRTRRQATTPAPRPLQEKCLPRHVHTSGLKRLLLWPGTFGRRHDVPLLFLIRRSSPSSTTSVPDHLLTARVADLDVRSDHACRSRPRSARTRRGGFRPAGFFPWRCHLKSDICRGRTNARCRAQRDISCTKQNTRLARGLLLFTCGVRSPPAEPIAGEPRDRKRAAVRHRALNSRIS